MIAAPPMMPAHAHHPFADVGSSIPGPATALINNKAIVTAQNIPRPIAENTLAARFTRLPSR
jgi:hypothetical protein